MEPCSPNREYDGIAALPSYFLQCSRPGLHYVIDQHFPICSVSIVSIGMGMAMMDFLVREARQVVTGKMAIIRFGSCGGLRKEHYPGTVVVASKGSVSVVRNPNVFGPSANVCCIIPSHHCVLSFIILRHTCLVTGSPRTPRTTYPTPFFLTNNYHHCW
jgi:hypothetical protein